MPIVSGPVGTILVACAVLASVVVWLARRRRYPGPRRLPEDDQIDREALEAAEREVRDLDATRRPDQGFEGDEWGPGVPRPRVRR
ncbi:MAG TPA: hypothetical protein VHR41_13985 [Gemmatimonadales bacterium]|nr:hypothetical protein [Gemmatimonadales bacterium]